MDRRNCGIPIRLVGDEVVPEFGGREAHGHYHRTFGEKGGQEAGEESMHVEKRHDQECPILRRQFIGELNVF